MHDSRRIGWVWCWLALAPLSALAANATAEDSPGGLTSPPQPGLFSLRLKSGGYDRAAYIQIPPVYATDKKLPVVVVLHGAGGKARGMLETNHWGPKADKEGFIVVAPDGLPPHPEKEASFLRNPRLWNSGQLQPNSPRAKIDDVAYINRLLDELKTKVPYDEARVFCAGHSNGAGMTFRLAAESASRFAAVGAVAGLMQLANPKPARPVPTLYIVGTEDPLVPLAGGEVKLPWGKKQNPPVADFLATWARAIGCQTEPKTLSDAEGLKKLQYVSSAGMPGLTVIYISGQGHQWPGGESLLSKEIIGPISDKLDATDALWDFFNSARPAAK